MDNTFISAIKYIFIESIGKIIYFPIWWYTVGTKKVLIFISREISGLAEVLSIRILFRNLLKPMYGDYSRSGRLISFFVRIFHFIFLIVATIVWIIIMFILLILWLILPIIVVYSIIFQIFNLPENYLFKIINGFRK